MSCARPGAAVTARTQVSEAAYRNGEVIGTSGRHHAVTAARCGECEKTRSGTASGPPGGRIIADGTGAPAGAGRAPRGSPDRTPPDALRAAPSPQPRPPRGRDSLPASWAPGILPRNPERGRPDRKMPKDRTRRRMTPPPPDSGPRRARLRASSAILLSLLM